jgi:hypothetical protein
LSVAQKTEKCPNKAFRKICAPQKKELCTFHDKELRDVYRSIDVVAVMNNRLGWTGQETRREEEQEFW